MPEYRRWCLEGGTYFLTIVTHERRPLFADERNVELLRSALETVRRKRPFTIDAAVVLPDHLHFIWTLPSGDDRLSIRLSRTKVVFTRSLRARPCAARSGSRRRKRESTVWQRRFWERLLRDGEDYQRHLDYIHYNPVKHGNCRCPHSWEASSFKTWVRHGVYDSCWGCQCDGTTDVGFRVPDLSGTVGE